MLSNLQHLAIDHLSLLQSGAWQSDQQKFEE